MKNSINASRSGSTGALFKLWSPRVWMTLLLVLASVLPAISPAASRATPTILVTGASGKLGAEVLQFLTAAGVQPQSLILVTRSPDKLASWSQRGAVVRKGDFDDPDTLPAAFAGGERMLLISSGETGAKLFPENQAAIDAAEKAGIKRIVYTSFVNAKKLGQIGVLPGHYQTEMALKKSGIKWIVLRNQDYMENTTGRAASIVASGVLRSEVGDGKVASVAHIDCAEAAAAALLTPGPENRVYEITGPELLGAQDVARVLSEVSGKPVRVEESSGRPQQLSAPTGGTPTSGVAGGGGAGGPSPEQLAFFEGLARAQRAGDMDIITNDFQTLTGHAPQSLKSVLEAQRAILIGGTP